MVTFSERKAEPLPQMRGGDELLMDSSRTMSGSVQELVRSWLDVPIPTLGDRTPREAVADEEGREKVHWLLKDFENHESRRPPADGRPEAKQLRRELGLNELGERSELYELDLAVGAGRKISETLLDFAGPVFEAEGAGTTAQVQAALRFATTVWNLVVLEQLDASASKLAEARAKLAPGRFPVKLLGHFDRLVERKRSKFPHDRRLVGNFEVHSSAAGLGVNMEATLTPEIAAKVRVAGLKP
jgi:hypothetical protein